jgi:hypothetical protein
LPICYWCVSFYIIVCTLYFRWNNNIYPCYRGINWDLKKLDHLSKGYIHFTTFISPLCLTLRLHYKQLH